MTNKNKVRDIFAYYEKDSSLSRSELVIAMLTELQEVSGFLSRDIQMKVAQTAGVNPGYVAAVIKNLPNLHAKPFHHEIKICISDRCKSKGGTELLKKLQKLLKIRPGQVTRDGRFLLTTEYCMHNCMHGPNVKIDGVLYQNVTADTIDTLLEKFGD